ncbi:MAG: hypothetical protein IJW98_05680 [Clostridia bacterium]|nr:hypothetical protein [Clostridia bacterium]
MKNNERLFALLGDLSPDLLAESFPETAEHSATADAPIRHARRILRAIAIYAACAAVVIAIAFLIPLLTRITDPLGCVVPKDYYRPDLIWANDDNQLHKSDPIGTDTPGSLYVTFTFSEDAPKDARYAVNVSFTKEGQLRLADTNEPYLLTAKDQKAMSEYLCSLGWETFEVGECHPLVTGYPGIYYAATRAQIEALSPDALYRAMGLNLTEVPGVSVEIRYQLLEGFMPPEYWDLDAKEYLYTNWHSRASFYSYPPSSLQLDAANPVVNQKEQTTVTLTLTHKDASCDQQLDCKNTHTYSPNYTMCLQVMINNRWYFVPIVHGEEADTEKEERTLSPGMTDTIHVPLSELYGTLPDGLYRFALRTTAPSIAPDWTGAAYAEFVIHNGQKPQIVDDPESRRLLRDEVLLFDAATIEQLEIGTPYEAVTAKLGAPVLDVSGKGEVFRHLTRDGFPMDLTYAESDGALRLVSIAYAVETVPHYPTDYYRPDLIWANGVNTDRLVLHSQWYQVNHPGPHMDLMGMFGASKQYLTTPGDPSRYAIYVTWEVEARFETDEVVPEDYAQRVHRYLTEQIKLETLAADPPLSPESPTDCYYVATRDQLDAIDLGAFMTAVEHPMDYSLTLSFHLGYQPVETNKGGS